MGHQSDTTERLSTHSLTHSDYEDADMERFNKVLSSHRDCLKIHHMVLIPLVYLLLVDFGFNPVVLQKG